MDGTKPWSETLLLINKIWTEHAFSDIPTILKKPIFKGMRLVKNQQVSNVQFSDQNYIFLWIPKVSLSKDINLYLRGENVNARHFNFSGIKVSAIKHKMPRTPYIALIPWWWSFKKISERYPVQSNIC